MTESLYDPIYRPKKPNDNFNKGGNVYPGYGVTSSGQIKFKFKGISI